ncbi:hypothetical protein F444_11656 [Phytophthora nicotianae P1976]|uniref:Uncharacterized protein n=2 Tax=Phytophthora nicotianae TaxID=4792 RepID=A0A080ZZT5_PHYNI|nr:hypothetical protein F444_11656 [Phytophthora nicotianae P1976]
MSCGKRRRLERLRAPVSMRVCIEVVPVIKKAPLCALAVVALVPLALRARVMTRTGGAAACGRLGRVGAMAKDGWGVRASPAKCGSVACQDPAGMR